MSASLVQCRNFFRVALGEPNYFSPKTNGLLVDASVHRSSYTFPPIIPNKAKHFRSMPFFVPSPGEWIGPVSPFSLLSGRLLPGVGEPLGAVNTVVRLGVHFSNSPRAFSISVRLADPLANRHWTPAWLLNCGRLQNEGLADLASPG